MAPSRVAAMPPPEPMLGSTRTRSPVPAEASRASAIASGVMAPVPAASTSGRGARTAVAVEGGGGGGSPAQAADRTGSARVRRTGRAVYRRDVPPRTETPRGESA